jgi:phage repressor protein C with HTH and peptisase S24 domain
LRELERARLRELEAYLKATGLDNYELTEADKDALRNYKNLQWKEFNIKELFGASTRGRRLKSEDRIPGILPFVTAGEAETGISAFIGNNVTVFESNTTTIDMFGSAKYRNYKYGADDHVAVIHTEKLQKHAAIFVTSACHQAAHTGKFNYGNNFYAKDADELYIMLPTADGKHPDFNAMERLIAAMQKIVIADVAKYTARNLEATQEVIDNHEERQEPAITPLHIYDIYQPGRIPLYTLRAACGYFDEGEVPEPEGWIDATGNGFTPDPKRHFAIHAKGDSMLPKIKDGNICVFEWYNAGTRNDEIVLTQSREYDPEYGGKYTIKRYHSEKVVSEEGWQHSKVELRPLNPDFDTVELTEDDDIRTIGIFKCVLLLNN